MTSQPYGTPLYFLYSPVVDGVTIADAPLRMMRSGQAFRKDVMFGQLLQWTQRRSAGSSSANACPDSLFGPLGV